MPQYDVAFINHLQSGFSLDSAAKEVKAAFKLSDGQLTKLLSQPKTTIKKGIDESRAANIKRLIEKCGFTGELTARHKPSASRSQPEAAPVTRSEANPETQQSVYTPPKAHLGDTVYCQNCGTVVNRSHKKCHQCGAVNLSVNGGRSKVAAGFLALFFGGLGVHRFYLSQWWGAFYIPFGLLGLTLPVTLIEAIYFWTCPKASWQQKYGHLPKSSVLLIVAIALLPTIAVIGIIAAVALPAYQDYSQRAKVTQGLVEIVARTRLVSDYALEHNTIPENNKQLGTSKRPQTNILVSIDVGKHGTVTGLYAPLIPMGEQLSVRYRPTFEMSGDKIIHVSWQCLPGTMPNKYLPPSCRSEDNQHTSDQSTHRFKQLQSPTSGVSVSIPQNWIAGIVPNDEASVTAGNTYKEAYMMLLEVDKGAANAESLQVYAANIASYYLETLEIANLAEQTEISNSAEQTGYLYEITAKVDSYQVVYRIGFYGEEGQTFYQLVTWSLKENFAENSADMNEIIKRFTYLE